MTINPLSPNQFSQSKNTSFNSNPGDHYGSCPNLENTHTHNTCIPVETTPLMPRHPSTEYQSLKTSWTKQKSYSWPQIHKADFLEPEPIQEGEIDYAEHFLVPAGHMALVEGWHVGLGKAAIVLGIQSIINALPLWLALRGELGEVGPPDWSKKHDVLQALAWSAFAEWGANVTDTLYLQGIRSQLHALPNWVQEFLSSLSTCFLDTVITTPLFFYRQKAIVNPNLSLSQLLTTSPFKEVYAGTGALLANNLGFMNVFYPLNECTIRATQSEHSVWRQVLIGIMANVVACTVAWPAEWLRAQQSLPEQNGKSAWEIFQTVQFSLPVIFRGFPAILFAAISGGIFTGLANKYMRQLPNNTSHKTGAVQEPRRLADTLTQHPPAVLAKQTQSCADKAPDPMPTYHNIQPDFV